MTASMRRTLWLGAGLLIVICGGALASPARITLHIPPRAAGKVPPSPERIARVAADVRHLAVDLGPRNLDHPDTLAAAEAWARRELEAAGLTVAVEAVDGHAHNLVATRAPPAGRFVEVGAHLDTCGATPGADDNASGVAALLELARDPAVGRAVPVRFVLYGNEEPPYFQTARMGSRVHAANLRAAGEDVAAAWVIESVGYYDDAPGTQRWPLGLGLVMPTTANFVGLVANPRSSGLLQEGLRRFRAASTLPSVGASVPGALPGADYSDHAEYWRVGIPAVMVTDMPIYRNPHYHAVTDVPEHVDAPRVAAVVDGLVGVLR
jgi:hypothetical protein